MAHQKVRLGVIGCGAISGAYLGMAKNFPIVELAACADLNPAAAKAQAEKYGVPKACGVEELLADPSIELVINLTIPKAHVPVAMQCLERGKHTYAEKPLGIDRDEACKLLNFAAEKKLLVGCAPDTFMGAGIQTARKLVDDGVIGQPVGFTAFNMGRGHENWHVSPEFYYEPGGGPMFDMGPYYLTALLQILGPVKRLMGIASIAIPERTIGSQPKFGKKIHVTTPDHVQGTLEFENGCVGTLVTSFATRAASYDGKNPIQIFGTKGALKVPDPNSFDGSVFLCEYGKGADGKDEYVEAPTAFTKGYGRSVGAADMAYAIRTGRDFRANGQQAFAVLELMQGFLDSSRQGKAIEPTLKYTRPAPMPSDLPFGTLDE